MYVYGARFDVEVRRYSSILGTSANASQLNFITIDDGVRAEIQSALLQGLEVTVHESPINVNGWQGSGYSIIDPEYGAGAYKISGGASGSTNPDTNNSKVDLTGVTGYLEKFAENLDNKYVQIAGKVLGELGKIKDALDIAENCSSSESVSLIVGYAGLGVMWALGMMAFLLFPFVAMIGAMLGVFIMGRLLAADIAQCKGD